MVAQSVCVCVCVFGCVSELQGLLQGADDHIDIYTYITSILHPRHIHVYTHVTSMFTPMSHPCLHPCRIHVYVYVIRELRSHTHYAFSIKTEKKAGYLS